MSFPNDFRSWIGKPPTDLEKKLLTYEYADAIKTSWRWLNPEAQSHFQSVYPEFERRNWKT